MVKTFLEMLAGTPANAKANAVRLAGTPANVSVNAVGLAGTPANAKAFPKTFCPPEYSNKDMVWT